MQTITRAFQAHRSLGGVGYLLLERTPWCVHLDAPAQRHGQQPVSGTAEPWSRQTGQVIRGLR